MHLTGGCQRATGSVRGVRLPRPRIRTPGRAQIDRDVPVYSLQSVRTCSLPVKTCISSCEMRPNVVPIDQQPCSDYKEKHLSRMSGVIRNASLSGYVIYSTSRWEKAPIT